MSAAPPTMRLAPRPKYLALALVAMQRSLAYRGTLLLSMVSNLVWVVVLYYLWRAVFASHRSVGGFDWDRMRTYVVLSYGVNVLLSFNSEARMMATIRTGEVASELARPVDYLRAQLAQALGSAVVEGLLGGALALLLGGVALHILAPASVAGALLFLPSVAPGFLVKFLISYLTGLLCFWTVNSLGLLWARAALTNVLSGALIPLQLFPDALRGLALASPFAAVVNAPVAIYLGTTTGAALIGTLALQGAWVAILWVLARALWIPSVRALTVQGG